jgi:hypothetical protein
MSNGLLSKLLGLGNSNQPAPSATSPCVKHWVAAHVRYKDDKTDVLSADAVIYQGTATINGGPLAAGELKSTGLDAGAYSFSLTDVHPDEWEAG